MAPAGKKSTVRRRPQGYGWSPMKEPIIPQTVVFEGGALDRPSTPEWDSSMQKHKGFTLAETEIDGPLKREVRFRVGDNALINPYRKDADKCEDDAKTNSEDEENEKDFARWWVGSIQEIRSRHMRVDGEADVWALVRWFYSGNDMEELPVDGPYAKIAQLYGEHERLQSDHEDLVSYAAFYDKVTIHSFDQLNLEQPFIPVNELYCRYFYQASRNPSTVTIKDTDASIYTVVCPVCHLPFDAGKHRDVHTIMRFCCREGCRKWYHQGCLKKNGHLDLQMSKQDREFSHIMASPDSTQAVLSFSDFDVDSARLGDLSVGSEIDPGCRAEMFKRLGIPQEVLEIAQQPISRGRNPNDIVGNIRAVIKARRGIYEALKKGWDSSKSFEGKLLDAGAESNPDVAVAFKCPNKGCQRII